MYEKHNHEPVLDQLKEAVAHDRSGLRPVVRGLRSTGSTGHNNRSAPRQQRHSQLNDIIWRALKWAQIPAVKEPVSLVRDDNKRPDGTTLLPWARGKPMAWDVTVPDTYITESHISSTVVKAGAAAHRAAQNKTDKYASLAIAPTFSVRLPSRQQVHGMRQP